MLKAHLGGLPESMGLNQIS
uniref:Uncharacterized protein n=1 Tax=Arundo donax TaxID=35708 RepID=A0A0A8ZWC8_ARUDO